MQAITLLRINVLPVDASLVEDATSIAIQHQLLMGDALVVASMKRQRSTMLASHDADFDRVPGIVRYSPS